MQRDVRTLPLRLLSVALCVPSLILTACGSTPESRFYVLTPMGQETASTEAPTMKVGLEPVVIPTAVDRPQMLMNVSANERTLWEFDRWAGSLAEDMTRVIGMNLETRLGPTSVYAQPSRYAPGLDYVVNVEILQLEADPDGHSTLTARFHIVDGSGEWVSSHLVNVDPAKGANSEGAAGVAKSVSSSLDTLSQAIVDALQAASASSPDEAASQE